MNLKKFIDYCYGDIAAELGYVRFKNGYYKIDIEERVLTAFALERIFGGRTIRPLMGIFPLCGYLFNGVDSWEMLQPLDAYQRHTRDRRSTDWTVRSSDEECAEVKKYLLAVLHDTELPFLLQVKDLETGEKAFWAYKQYSNEGTLNPFTDCSASINYWGFLLSQGKYEEALRNFARYAKKAKKEELFPEDTDDGMLQRLLINHQYDKVDSFVYEQEQANIQQLKEWKLI